MSSTVRHPAAGVASAILLAIAAACTDGTSPNSSTRPTYVAVAAGSGFTCALTSDQATYCWGYPHFRERDSLPARVATPEPLVTLTAGDYQFCGIGESGRAYCWGMVLEDVDIGRTYPDGWLVSDTLRFLQLAPGLGHVCGVTTDSTAVCWGDYSGGMRGQGGPIPGGWANSWNLSPNTVAGGLAYRQLAAGSLHTCGVIGGGHGDPVACWGDSIQIGNSSTVFSHGDSMCSWFVDTCATQPALGPPLTGVMLLASGSRHTCAMASQGLRCWGSNDYFALGAPGHFGDTPSVVTLPEPVMALSARGNRTCALVASGAAWCWGARSVDQSGAYVNDSTLPEAVPFDDQFVALSTGSGHTCGLTGRGRLFCWGLNWGGSLGNGSTKPSPVPVEVAPPRS